MIYRLIAGFSLHVRCRAVPPFQVAKCLLDVSPGKLSFNCITDTCRTVYPILFEEGLDTASEATATSSHLAEVAGAKQH